MKIKTKNILKTTFSKLRFHEQKQFLQQCGSNLCIRSLFDTKQIEPDFIRIGESTFFYNQPFTQDSKHSPTVIKLYDFISSTTHKFIFTAQCVQKNQTSQRSIQICSYALRQLTNQSNETGGMRAQRRSIKLSQVSGYVPLQNIQNIEFVYDYGHSHIIYAITKTLNMECYCITLLDMLKLKVLAQGFIPFFQKATISPYEDSQITILGTNYIKKIKLQQKQQSFSIKDEKLPKKLLLGNQNFIKHHWIGPNRLLLSTAKAIYITEGESNSFYQILSTITVIEQSSSQNSIFDIIIFNKTLIVFMENLDILVYNEDGEEGSNKYELAEITNLNKYLQIDKKSKIPKLLRVQISSNHQQMMISLNNGQYYYTRFEELELGSEQNHFSFEKIPFTFYEPSQGQILASGGQNFCVISVSNAIELWDLQKASLINRMQFDISGGGKIYSKCALNPDGHSICVAFPDRIRFYRILINAFKLFSEIFMTKCNMIQYSHGGQMIACSSARMNGGLITIIDTMKFKQICSFKVGHAVKQLIWNQYDDTLYALTNMNMIKVFNIQNKTKEYKIQLPKQGTFIRYDFSTKNVIVSLSDGSILSINKASEIEPVETHLEGLQTVFPSDGIYFGITKFGKLYYSANLNFSKKYELSLFSGPYKLVYRKGYLIAYTDTSNILVLNVKIPQNAQNAKIKSADSENIMLVEKQEIIKLFDRTKYLESQLEQLQNLTTVKLDEQRKKYNESIQQLSKKFQKQTDEIKKQNIDLQVQSTKNNKYSQRMFDELETGQIRSVNELEKVYDLKIKLQKQKYLTLEQQAMQQKMRYQSMISKIEENYHADIQKVRRQYANKLEQKSKEIQMERNKNMAYKKKLETKLIDLEEENEITLFQLQNKKDDNIKNLIEKNTKLERQYDSVMIELHNMKEEFEQIKTQNERNIQKLKRNEKSVNQNQNRVRVIEKQLEQKNKMIEQKNIVIQQQLHQISELQKSKYVLTFRAYEIRKTLQPKEQLIQKLKSSLLKIEQESKEQKKNKFQIEKTAQKYMKILQTLRKQNQQLKIAYKNNVSLHKNLCSDIYTVMNNIDPKERSSYFVQIYQKYVKEQNIGSQPNSNFKSDPTSEEINRHLIHVEQSLQQVALGNEKMLDGKKKQIQRKMKENAELLYELNIMRKKLREYQKRIQEKDIEISKLHRENKQVREMHKSTRANTAQTGFTRRIQSRDPASIRNTNQMIDLSIRRQSDYLIPDRKGARSRVVSAHKTMAWREDSRKEKSKISDLAKELELSKNTVRRQQKMIQQLNQRLLGFPEIEG